MILTKEGFLAVADGKIQALTDGECDCCYPCGACLDTAIVDIADLKGILQVYYSTKPWPDYSGPALETTHWSWSEVYVADEFQKIVPPIIGSYPHPNTRSYYCGRFDITDANNGLADFEFLQFGCGRDGTLGPTVYPSTYWDSFLLTQSTDTFPTGDYWGSYEKSDVGCPTEGTWGCNRVLADIHQTTVFATNHADWDFNLDYLNGNVLCERNEFWKIGSVQPKGRFTFDGIDFDAVKGYPNPFNDLYSLLLFPTTPNETFDYCLMLRYKAEEADTLRPSGVQFFPTIPALSQQMFEAVFRVYYKVSTGRLIIGGKIFGKDDYNNPLTGIGYQIVHVDTIIGPPPWSKTLTLTGLGSLFPSVIIGANPVVSFDYVG